MNELSLFTGAGGGMDNSDGGDGMSNRTLPLFPEMEAEILSDRKAERRERKTHALGYLQKKDGYRKWLLGVMKKYGPMHDAGIWETFIELLEIERDQGIREHLSSIVRTPIKMHEAGELWRIQIVGFGVPFDPSYAYGIIGFHHRKDFFPGQRQVDIDDFCKHPVIGPGMDRCFEDRGYTKEYNPQFKWESWVK